MFQNIFKSGNAIVQEIHDEIDQAQDNLLAEANKIIAENPINDLAERHLKLGFVNSEIVGKNRLVKMNKDQAELISYYKQNYPFNKFITDSEMDRICAKYNLIYAPIHAYKKNVPEKNLGEIENVIPLKSEDSVMEEYWYSYHGRVSGLSQNELLILRNGIRLDRATDNIDNNEIISAFFKKDVNCAYLRIDRRQWTIQKSGFFIAAPKSHFDLSKLSKSGLFGFMNIEIAPVKDPIVFRYCRGGIQIISKWGLEASDEAIINPIEN